MCDLRGGVIPKRPMRLLLRLTLLAWLTGSAGAQDDPPAANPLKQFFRNFDRNIREGAEAIEQARRQRDQLDLRPHQRAEEIRQLDKARDLIRRERWHDAVEVLQYLLDQPSDTFLMEERHTFRPLKDQAERLLSELPEEGWRTYLSRHAADAEDLERKARETQDESLFRELIDRYRLTPAGVRGVEAWGRLLADRGRLHDAAGMLARNAGTCRDPAAKVTWSRQAIALLIRAGDPDAAHRLGVSLGWTLEAVDALTREIPPAEFRDVHRRVGSFLTMEPEPTGMNPEDLVLFPIWSERLIERDAIRESVGRLQQMLIAEGRALVSVRQPLVVGDLLILRTLQSLQTRRVSDGTLLYEVRMSPSPEVRLAAGQLHDSEVREADPLSTLLFRDGVFGSVSSDGRQLFAIEEQGTLEVREHDRWGRQDGPPGPWDRNELVAYDLQTGRVRWRVGGPQIEAEFSRPLAGTYFFGAPVPRGTELYVIGEQAGEITLFCLGAESGEELWSQSLTTAGRPLGEDVVRRQWECRPMFVDGLVICPTTTGWIVAVDPNSRRLRWGARLPPRLTNFGQYRHGFTVHGTQELNQRWLDMVLHVQGTQLYVTPLEMPDELSLSEPVVICLDVRDGQELWKVPKGDLLYVAGIHDRGVLVVGRTRIALLGREDGKPLWTTSLPELPMGRGILAGGQFLQPLANRLLYLDAATGKTLRTTPFSDESATPRNLTVAGDLLISLSPDRIQAFPSLSERQSPVATALVEAAREWQLIRNLEAEGQLSQAWERLRTLGKATDLPSHFQEQMKDLEWRLLVQVGRSGALLPKECLSRLRELATTPARQFELEMLEVELLSAEADWRPGATRLVELFRKTDQERASVQLGNRDCHRTVWLGERLRGIFQRLTPEEQLAFESWLRDRLFNDPAGPPADQELATALWFHPIGQAAELRLAGSASEGGKQGQAMLRLRRVTQSGDPEIQSLAWQRLEELFTKAGWLDSAAQCRAQSRFAFTSGRPAIRPNEATENLASNSPETAPSPATNPKEVPVDTLWTVTRIGPTNDEGGPTRMRILDADLSDWNHWDINYQRGTARLEFQPRASTGHGWSVPLGSLDELEHHSTPGIRTVGSMMYVAHAGVLHALSLIDRQVAWTWVPDLPPNALSRLPVPFQRSTTRMQSPGTLVSAGRLSSQDRSAGYLLTAHERALILRCQDLIALDPVTGEELWRDRDVPSDANIEVVGDVLLILVPGKRATVRSITSGQTLDGHPLSQGMLNLLGRFGDRLVILAVAERQSFELQVIDSQGTVLHAATLPETSLMTKLDPRCYCWVTKAGEVFSFDAAELRTIPLGLLVEELGKPYRHVHALADRERIYVMIDRGESHLSHVNIPSIRFSGEIVAYSRDGHLLWKAEMNAMDLPSGARDPESQERWSRSLLIDEFDENPLLLFAGDRPDHFQDLYFHRLQLIGFDKRTGKQVLDWKRSSEAGGFSELHVNVADQTLTLQTYNDRLFIAPRPTPPEGSGETK